MKFHYLLEDNSGVSDIWDCEMLIPVGAKFLHEYGLYEVRMCIDSEGEETKTQAKIEAVVCEKLKSNQELKNK